MIVVDTNVVAAAAESQFASRECSVDSTQVLRAFSGVTVPLTWFAA